MSKFIKQMEIDNKTNIDPLFWLWFFTILLFALVFRLVFINAPLASYDTWLLYLAKNYNLTGEMSPSIHIYRLGMIIPIKIFVRFFGFSINTYYLIAFTFSISLISIIYLICQRFFNLKVAVIACLIFGSSFFSLETGTVVLTDIPSAFYTLLSIYLFYFVLNTSGKKKFIFLFFSTLAGFLVYLTKMQNVTFLISIPIYEFLTTKKIKYSLIFGSIFALLLATEFTYYYLRLGDPLAPFHVAKESQTDWVLDYEFHPVSLLNFIIRVPVRLFTSWSGKFALIGGIIGIGIGIFKKNISLIVLSSGAIAFFIINSYIPLSVSPLVPAQPFRTRYFLTFQVILIIGLAYLIDWIWEKARTIKIADILFGLLICLLITVQTFELPVLISNLQSKNNAFPVADQLLEEYLQFHKINEPVYAFPVWDFWLYPSFKNLELKPFNARDFSQTFKPGFYLFPKDRVLAEGTYYAPMRGDFNAINNNILLLLNNKKEWDYLIDTRDIRLVNIPTIELTCNDQFNLSTNLDGYILTPESVRSIDGEIIINLEPTQLFELSSSPYDVNFSPTHADDPAIIIKDALYQFNLEYQAQTNLQKATLIWYEYAKDGEMIHNLSWDLFTTSGSHSITINVIPVTESTTFRFIFRLKNTDQAPNEVKLHKVELSSCK